MPTRYRVSSPNIVADVIDGEAVIIHLEKGTYYSLLAPGAEVWEAVTRGATDVETQREMKARYAGESSDIEHAVSELIAEMEREGLLLGESVTGEGAVVVHTDAVSVDRPPFQRPELKRYSDMEAILMMDPIHEVDEAGWPAAKRPE
ncbi:MAG: PqqD family protein [Gemmatimonadota bacterium]